MSAFFIYKDDLTVLYPLHIYLYIIYAHIDSSAPYMWVYFQGQSPVQVDPYSNWVISDVYMLQNVWKYISLYSFSEFRIKGHASSIRVTRRACLFGSNAECSKIEVSHHKFATGYILYIPATYYWRRLSISNESSNVAGIYVADVFPVIYISFLQQYQ